MPLRLNDNKNNNKIFFCIKMLLSTLSTLSGIILGVILSIVVTPFLKLIKGRGKIKIKKINWWRSKFLNFVN